MPSTFPHNCSMPTTTISSDRLTWHEVHLATGDTTDITTSLLLDNMRWEASTVGEWRIEAWAVSENGFNISDSITVYCSAWRGGLGFGSFPDLAHSRG